MVFSYAFPRPSVTADCLIIKKVQDADEILLIRRDKPPFEGMWALPGGFMEPDESLLYTAMRELEEETGLTGIALTPFRVYDEPGRDPRGRTITLVFYGFCGEGTPALKAASDAREAGWHNIEKLPPLAFDHEGIVKDFLSGNRGDH